MQIVDRHRDAVAIAPNQILDTFDGFLTWRAVADTGGDHHVLAEGAQFIVGLVQDGAVVRAKVGWGKYADHARRLLGQGSADGRGVEFGYYAVGGFGRSKRASHW